MAGLSSDHSVKGVLFFIIKIHYKTEFKRFFGYVLALICQQIVRRKNMLFERGPQQQTFVLSLCKVCETLKFLLFPVAISDNECVDFFWRNPRSQIVFIIFKAKRFLVLRVQRSNIHTRVARNRRDVTCGVSNTLRTKRRVAAFYDACGVCYWFSSNKKKKKSFF